MIRSLILLQFIFTLPLFAQFKNGDLVFTRSPKSSKSTQHLAIRAATGSPWTHVAVIYLKNGKPMVLEAVQPIQIIPLASYLKRSGTHEFRRLKDRSKLTKESDKKALTFAKRHLHHNYDGKFQWSDKLLYCSELVWKIYHHSAGIKLCEVRRFKSYNLSHPTVKRLIKLRYSESNKINLNEKVVAPSDLYASPLLEKFTPMTKPT